MEKLNGNSNTGTVLKNHQISKFIKGLSEVISEHPKEFSTINLSLSPELTITVSICDFFNIGYVDDKLKILIEKDLPEHIKMKIFKLFDDNISAGK